MSLRATRTVYWDKNGWTILVIPRDALIVLNDTVARCRLRLPTKSRHSSTIVTWKFEYKCEMVVSPLRDTTSCNPPSFNGETSDVPETFIVGVGLSSVVFSSVARSVVITKVGVFVKPTNACS